MIERSFEEEKRRSKVIPKFGSEKAALKLVYSALIRASVRWRRVKMGEAEREELREVRKELGLAVDEREVVHA